MTLIHKCLSLFVVLGLAGWLLTDTVAAQETDPPTQEKNQEGEQENQKTEKAEGTQEEGTEGSQEEGTEGTEQGEGDQEETGDTEGTEEGKEDDSQPEPLATDIPGLKAQLTEVDGQIDAKQAEFDTAEDDIQRAKIRDEYVTLVARANLIVDKIRTLAIEQYDGGDQSPETLELLTGIMINDAAFDKDAAVLELGAKLIDKGIDPKYFEAAANADRLSLAAKEIFDELVVRQKEAAADDLPRVKLTTSKGEVVLELFENEAPQTVGNFVNLVESGFYNGLKFHRVIEGFMAQGGDPNGDGSGGPGYNIYCECYKPDARRHFSGTLSMAKKPARDTGGSQFFITFSRTSHLDGQHTVFGRVVSGMDVVYNLQRINPEAPGQVQADTIQSAEVLRKRETEYKPTKVGG